MIVHDYIVVGSGCTGAMAAQTLVEAGVNVTMLDVGITDDEYSNLIPNKNFDTIRKQEENQHQYFIGNNFEGISWGKIKTGEHLTPPRKHMIRDTNTFLPITSSTFFPMESLSYGGLGNGWGVGCCQFSELELKAAGLNSNDMTTAYDIVGARIGVSGMQDDATRYTLGTLKNYQQPLQLDKNHQRIYEKYNSNKKYFIDNSFYLGRPALAVITDDLEDRKKYQYRDMDFYADKDESAYRPWITINKLKKQNNFQYINKCLVLSIKENEHDIDVNCLRVDTNEKVVFKCKKLVLSPGVLSTARIILRSFQNINTQLPILCNPYAYIPCLQPRFFGRKTDDKKVGFAQLSLFLDEQKNNFDVTMASLYSYNSLMLYRIIKEAPLNFRDGIKIMNYLMSGIVIMGIHHPETRGLNKYIELKNDVESLTGDKLHANYLLSASEKNRIEQNEKKYIKAMRQLGVYALKRINPGMGSSIHYAGTLPFSENKNPFTCSYNGKLNGTKNIYIADGSGFNYLPAKGLTFSLMANAHRIALHALKNE